jgi:RNA recognition motif-containing protein
MKKYETSQLRHHSPVAPNKDEVTLTDLVIKNIPYAIRRECFIDMMIEKKLPLPYAFNYHFKDRVFRGLAFANFKNRDETSRVIDVLNSLDVRGRKLKVEYKKIQSTAQRDHNKHNTGQRLGHLQTQLLAPRPSLNSGIPLPSPLLPRVVNSKLSEIFVLL